MINLREIIWEICETCFNNCSYCGSHETRDNSLPTVEHIMKIAHKICAYPPDEVNISGGDPLIFNYETHEKITNLFRKNKIKPKIIVNPLSIHNNFSKLNILDLYSVAGVSVNTENELDKFHNVACSAFEAFSSENTTIITNFNKSNLWLFESIFDLVKKNNYCWQIQFTVYQQATQDEDEYAVYASDLSTKVLFDKIQAAMEEYKNIIIADNMNGGKCSAGMASLGILADGTVVPCLSMRSWVENVYAYSQGCLTDDTTLADIWMNQFKKQRFNKFTCCKDHCCNRVFEYDAGKDCAGIIDSIKKLDIPVVTTDVPWKETVYVYAVADPNRISVLYGVKLNPNVDPYTTIMAYAVQQKKLLNEN